MRKHIWRAVKIVTGVSLLGLGVIGLLLPVIPQIPFLVLGLSILSTESTRAKTLLNYLEERVGWRKRATPSESGRSNHG